MAMVPMRAVSNASVADAPVAIHLSKTVTSAVRGQLRDAATRAEAMSLILGR